MKKKKVFFVFGTRPEALKLAPLILAAKKSKLLKPVICFTGQHKEMAYQVLNLFKLKPDFDLSVMKPNQSLSLLTERLIEKLEVVFVKEKPDLVIVQGDTTTAFVGALAAFYQRIKIAHVEAGLRSFDKYQPFPEEMNRAFISQMADWNFPPTKLSSDNLKKSGVPDSKIFITGNTVVDALKLVEKRLNPRSHPKLSLLRESKRIIIGVTTHRRENFGKPLQSICKGILQLVKKYPNIEIAWLLHLNPQVQQIVRKMVSDKHRIHLLPPLDYLEFLSLMKLSHFMISDSGGVQEEAPSLSRPVLVLRNVTERPEGVDAGVNKLVGTDSRKIVHEASLLLDNKKAYLRMTGKKNPYGDGKASQRILQALLRKGAL